jgi:hypothetical protein
MSTVDLYIPQFLLFLIVFLCRSVINMESMLFIKNQLASGRRAKPSELVLQLASHGLPPLKDLKAVRNLVCRLSGSSAMQPGTLSGTVGSCHTFAENNQLRMIACDRVPIEAKKHRPGVLAHEIAEDGSLVMIVMSTISLLENAIHACKTPYGGVFQVDATFRVNKEGLPLLTFGTVSISLCIMFET